MTYLTEHMGRPCPHCGEELKVPPHAPHNVAAYGKSATTVTDCCGHAVRIHLVKAFRVTKLEGPAGEDDWGRNYKASKPETEGK